MQRKNDYFSRQSYERKEKQARGEKLQEIRTKHILKARCSSPLFLWYVTCAGALQPRAIATKPLCCCQIQGNSSHFTLRKKKHKVFLFPWSPSRKRGSEELLETVLSCSQRHVSSCGPSHLWFCSWAWPCISSTPPKQAQVRVQGYEAENNHYVTWTAKHK